MRLCGQAAYIYFRWLWTERHGGARRYVGRAARFVCWWPDICVVGMEDNSASAKMIRCVSYRPMETTYCCGPPRWTHLRRTCHIDRPWMSHPGRSTGIEYDIKYIIVSDRECGEWYTRVYPIVPLAWSCVCDVGLWLAARGDLYGTSTLKFIWPSFDDEAIEWYFSWRLTWTCCRTTGNLVISTCQ